MNDPVRLRLLATTMIGGLALGAGLWAAPASAQTAAAAAAEKPANEVGEIVVTGSRIRRAETDTPAPVLTVDAQTITDKGFTQASQVINDLTANVPALPQAATTATPPTTSRAAGIDLHR